MRVSKRRGRNRQQSNKCEARYANYFEVGHNAFEFIFDFGQYYPDTECAQMHSRLVMGPVYAKLLADLLKGAIQRFEEANGAIHSIEDEMDPLELVKQSIVGYDRRPSVSLKKTGGRTSD